MAWHADLCDAVASGIAGSDSWRRTVPMDVSARAKTIDTLRDKLRREKHLKLNQVQDVAGVRVDISGSLEDQTLFAEDVASLFGVDRADIKDIRRDPHSGYRAVHVWLRLPAGRVEVQVRTRGQSAWANMFERLGDHVGRHIRYGEDDPDPAVNRWVSDLMGFSDMLAAVEEAQHQLGTGRRRAFDPIRLVDRAGPLTEALSEFLSIVEVARQLAAVLPGGEEVADVDRRLEESLEQIMTICIRQLEMLESTIAQATRDGE